MTTWPPLYRSFWWMQSTCSVFWGLRRDAGAGSVHNERRPWLRTWRPRHPVTPGRGSPMNSSARPDVPPGTSLRFHFPHKSGTRTDSAPGATVTPEAGMHVCGRLARAPGAAGCAWIVSHRRAGPEVCRGARTGGTRSSGVGARRDAVPSAQVIEETSAGTAGASGAASPGRAASTEAGAEHGEDADGGSQQHGSCHVCRRGQPCPSS